MITSNVTRAIRLSILNVALATASCTSLQSVSVNGVPADRRRPVEASATNTALLGIHFDNDFIDGLTDRLKAQCPGGKVTGVYTKHETTWYVLVQERHVRVSGFCVYEAALARRATP